MPNETPQTASIANGPLHYVGGNYARNIFGDLIGESDSLECWWGLSYASFVTIPRPVMQSMPVEWQDRIADLLRELDSRQDWRPKEGYYLVQMDVTAYDTDSETDGAREQQLIPASDYDCDYRHAPLRALNPPPESPTPHEIAVITQIVGFPPRQEYTAVQMTEGLRRLEEDRWVPLAEGAPDAVGRGECCSYRYGGRGSGYDFSYHRVAVLLTLDQEKNSVVSGWYTVGMQALFAGNLVPQVPYFSDSARNHIRKESILAWRYMPEPYVAAEGGQ
jgi:hypothetical protein